MTNMAVDFAKDTRVNDLCNTLVTASLALKDDEAAQFLFNIKDALEHAISDRSKDYEGEYNPFIWPGFEVYVGCPGSNRKPKTVFQAYVIETDLEHCHVIYPKTHMTEAVNWEDIFLEIPDGAAFCGE